MGPDAYLRRRGLVLLTIFISIFGAFCADVPRLPQHDLDFLRRMAVDVIAASSVAPGSNGGGRWPQTNSCGFALITPGKNTYTAFWIRDFSMAADSGLISAPVLLDHLLLICRCQNGSSERKLAHGLHLPPWSIPDHINYNGRPSFFPGTYSSGEEQGDGTFGRLPPADDHYEFIHIAYQYWRMSKDPTALVRLIDNVTVFDRLCRAFAAPVCDASTGLVQTSEDDRAVGFGFCDAEVHTGKLLFASLLRYRAAGELAEMAKELGRTDLVAQYRGLQQSIRANVPLVFADPAVGGWLRASTGISHQPDVWGTLFALHLGILNETNASAARRAIAAGVRLETIVYEGGVRYVPTDMDFSSRSAWERSVAGLNTYQNGGYWHTASGWLIEALWPEDQNLALTVFGQMMGHLRSQDYRKGPGFGAPWEVYGRNGQGKQNPVYLASIALPYAILKDL